MGFEMFTPNPHVRRRRQGPAKLVVTQAPNGRTTVSMSAAVRDWLGPTPGDKDRRWPDNRPRMRVAILIDRDERKLMISRRPDDDTAEGVYRVNGLSNSCYISDWNLNQSLGLEPGHYPAELLGSAVETADHAALISLDDRAESATRTRKRSKDSSGSSIDEQRIAEIRSVLDEGIDMTHE